jgi:protein-tyrosine-phosphatase
MPIKILFTCPHAAGKSLAAATYFGSAAFRAELDVEIAVAGPEPDDHNMPTVVDALTAEGFRIDWHPRLITDGDTADADHVISIGCDHEALPSDVEVDEWDAPLISQDLTGSLRAIHDHCESLARQLAN